LRRLPYILILLITATIFFACKNEVKNVVNHPTDPNKVPTIVTHDVTTLISDSGITKYKITSKIWYIFQEAKKPFWSFPEGLRLEEYDSVFKTAASIRCDSAIYYSQDKIWRLDGNVRIWNVHNELILTNQLFWSQNDRKVYSDSFIHIEKEGRVLEGYGFVSNEQLTTYHLNKPAGIFPIDERKLAANRQPSGPRPSPATRQGPPQRPAGVIPTAPAPVQQHPATHPAARPKK
jgi:LPS export ABC transporter protein LptC